MMYNERPNPRRARANGGFSLLEMMIATGILLASVALLAQLASVGRRHLDAAAEKAIATRLCQNALARLLAGVDPIKPEDGAPLAEDLDWDYRVAVNRLPMETLTQLEVSVRKNDATEPSVQADAGNWFTLVRWIPTRLVDSRALGSSRPMQQLPSETSITATQQQ